MRAIALVPALNEEGTIASVVEELRAFDPELEMLVVDDGSHDRTAEVARRAGARVLRLPFNLGIGGAVQTGFRYAFENGFDLAVRVDGDGQHDPSQLAAVIEPVLARRDGHRRRLALPRPARRRLPLVARRAASAFASSRASSRCSRGSGSRIRPRASRR